ncbi:MAG: alpha/beta hydrolase [Alphaproteobacteria bacterium]|nr:alpha/beta hydrolase [Alphaproteobacteria bacterium]
MRHVLEWCARIGLIAGLAAAPAAAQQAGSRQLPARTIPVPQTASPEMQAIIARPLNPIWNVVPKTAAEWKALVAANAAETIATLPAMISALHVKVEPATIAAVKTYVVTPEVMAPANRNRVLLYFHGGGFVLRPGEAGLAEAIELAGFGHFKVISVDYRMAPDFPFPAAMDDAMAVYRETLKTTKARNIGIFGTSAGGSITLAMVLRARTEGLPLPGAIAPGTPWSDMTKTGDSYFTNDGIDNVLVSEDGFWGAAALLYANGHDLKDPQLSPVYGDLHGFPPTILTSGTRDLFLSNTVRVHRKLRQAGVEAQLQVFEGLSHAQYYRDINAPETIDYNNEIARFFDQHLGR